MGTASMVARPTLSFPLASYEEEGFDIIVRGNATAVLEGDAWGMSWRIKITIKLIKRNNHIRRVRMVICCT